MPHSNQSQTAAPGVNVTPSPTSRANCQAHTGERRPRAITFLRRDRICAGRGTSSDNRQQRGGWGQPSATDSAHDRPAPPPLQSQIQRVGEGEKCRPR